MDWESKHTKKHIAEAAVFGCVLLGPGKDLRHRNYRLPCKHEQEVQTGNMRVGNFRCRICVENKLIDEAAIQGCLVLGPGRSRHYRKYALPCKHEQDIRLSEMRIGNFHCQTCLKNKHIEEAAVFGCILLGPGKSYDYRNYKLPCKHEQEVRTGLMRVGTFRCQTCEESSRTQPSNIYLFHICVGEHEWLKLGYAKDIEYRGKKYGLPENARINLLASVAVNTGDEAHSLETYLHAEYAPHRLPRMRMRKFHTSGYTECYPMGLMPALLSEFR